MPAVRPAHWILAGVVLLAGLSPGALAKGGKDAPGKAGPGKPPEWEEEAGRQVLHVFDPSPLKAYVQAPGEPDPA